MSDCDFVDSLHFHFPLLDEVEEITMKVESIHGPGE